MSSSPFEHSLIARPCTGTAGDSAILKAGNDLEALEFRDALGNAELILHRHFTLLVGAIAGVKRRPSPSLGHFHLRAFPYFASTRSTPSRRYDCIGFLDLALSSRSAPACSGSRYAIVGTFKSRNLFCMADFFFKPWAPCYT